MQGPIVIFLDAVHPKVWDSLLTAGYTCSDHSDTAAHDLADVLIDATGLIVRHRLQLDETLLQHAGTLKWIGRSGVGLDNIDLGYCKKQGIAVVNAAGGNAMAVAEHVVGMILGLIRHQYKSDKEVRKGIWRREANRGVELASMTLGIIGYGNTGRALAECLRSFGPRVLAFDKYSPVTGTNAEAACLEEIHDTADIISFHVPLTEETYHYFDHAFLDKMKRPFYFINAARGPVADLAAIAEGIRSEKIVGAGLDVLEEEPKDEGILSTSGEHLSYLIGSEKVIFSPHIAGWTVQSYERLADVLISRILELE